ncbi:hypothetical protein MHEL_39500 [Mycolicibacterium helvum]|uniref:SDR family oxidoreductase n=1 Tax=Mycolicibacterium helvum TaxID=1534349 RepID=A0A7I7T8W5_9MYCO|nr:hypothetical protein MHEL_39500 [Mycolicibacterium helvum]
MARRVVQWSTGNVGAVVPCIEPQDVSNAVVFLASDDAGYITGTQLRVDAGGYIKNVPWSG